MYQDIYEELDDRFNGLCDPKDGVYDPYDSADASVFNPPIDRQDSPVSDINGSDASVFSPPIGKPDSPVNSTDRSQAPEKKAHVPYDEFVSSFAEDFARYGNAYAVEHHSKPSADKTDSEKAPRTDVSPPKRPLQVFNCEELAERCYARKEFLVSGFLTSGLTVLAGSPKVGKSWFVMQLCMQIAKGEPFLGLATTKSGVLYIALEDDERRLQRRVFTITDDMPNNFYMTTACSRISDNEEFEKELLRFWVEHKDVKLIVIDTFQKVRTQGRELSYANDYSEVSLVKKIADTLNIGILMVHHTRKMGDADYMNEISGTNGIAGSADTLMVLKKEKRSSRSATLSCTGRDIEDREMTLHMDRETCIWEKTGDNHEDAGNLPEEIGDLVSFMKEKTEFTGTNSDLAAQFTQATGWVMTPSRLKRTMNQYRYDLKDLGVSFLDFRKNNQRMINISYQEPPTVKK